LVSFLVLCSCQKGGKRTKTSLTRLDDVSAQIPKLRIEKFEIGNFWREKKKEKKEVWSIDSVPSVVSLNLGGV